MATALPLSATGMSKSLSQIAFDFGETPLPSVAPTPPAIIEIMEEELVDKNDSEPENTVVAEPESIDLTQPTIDATEPAEQEIEVKKKQPGAVRGRKSLREASLTADMIDIPSDEELFKKSYYPIGQVAKMFKENQSLIRYWETEFTILKPKKNGKGDRLFRPEDVKNLVLIHDLLRRRKFTIEGAKEYLKKNKKAEDHFAMIQSLQQIKSFLLEIKASL